MRIVLPVSAFFPSTYGGGQVYVHHLAKELQLRGHKVTILSSSSWTNGEGDYCIQRYEHGGLPVYSIQVNPRATHLADAYSQTGRVLMDALREFIEGAQPNLVHLNGFKAALTTICTEMSIPYLVTAHHPGFVCPAGALLTPDQSICDKRARPEVCIPCCSRQRAPNAMFGMLMGAIPRWVYKPVGRYIGQRNHGPYPARGLAYPWFVEESLRAKRLVLDHAPLIIAPSESIRKFLLLNGVEPRRIRLLPHGIKPIGTIPMDSLNGRPIRFGYMGSINPPKGFHVLIEALQQILPDKACEVHVFGEPQYPWEKSYLDRTMSKCSGTSKVVFHGRIGNRSLNEAYTQIDVLVVPSIYLEVFGLVVLEAFSAGRPVIVSDSGGPAELVHHGMDGLVVERNDRTALAKAMQEILDNPRIIQDMADRIPGVRSVGEYVDEIEGIYFDLLEKK